MGIQWDAREMPMECLRVVHGMSETCSRGWHMVFDGVSMGCFTGCPFVECPAGRREIRQNRVLYMTPMVNKTISKPRPRGSCYFRNNSTFEYGGDARVLFEDVQLKSSVLHPRTELGITEDALR